MAPTTRANCVPCPVRPKHRFSVPLLLEGLFAGCAPECSSFNCADGCCSAGICHLGGEVKDGATCTDSTATGGSGTTGSGGGSTMPANSVAVVSSAMSRWKRCNQRGAAIARADAFLKGFTDEARLAAYLSHPNIAQVYDLQPLEGRGLVLEYVPGRSLKEAGSLGRGAGQLDAGLPNIANGAAPTTKRGLV